MTTFSLLSSLVIYFMHTTFYFPRACCNFCHAAIVSSGFAKASVHCLWQFLLWNKTSCCTFIVFCFFFYESVPVLYMHVYMKKDTKRYFSSELNCAKKAIFTSKWAFKSNLVFILFLRNLPRIVLLTHFFKLFFSRTVRGEKSE